MKKGWEITVDRRALGRLLRDIVYVVWRIVRRVGMAMLLAIGVLSLLGYTPATAPHPHICSRASGSSRATTRSLRSANAGGSSESKGMSARAKEPGRTGRRHGLHSRLTV